MLSCVELWHSDPKVTKSHAKIKEKFANYFLKTKAKKCFIIIKCTCLWLQKSISQLLRFNKSTRSMWNKCNFLYQPGSLYDTKVPSSYANNFLKTEKLKSCMYGGLHNQRQNRCGTIKSNQSYKNAFFSLVTVKPLITNLSNVVLTIYVNFSFFDNK